MPQRLIAIAGASGAGKSTLALGLATSLRVTNVLSTDLLRALYDPRAVENPMEFPLRVLDSWRAVDNVAQFDAITAALHAESEGICARLLPALRFAAARGHSVIVDGFHLLPASVDSTWGDLISTRIALCGLTEATLRSRQEARGRDTHRGSTRARTPDELGVFLALDRLIRDQATQRGWAVIDANVDREQARTEALALAAAE